MDQAQRERIESFRRVVEAAAGGHSLLGPPLRDDRPDDSTLVTRWPAAEHLWYELAVRPLLPQVRVGIATDDRWKNEDLEDLVESSGDTMSEFVGVAFEDAGLDWPEPPVEHYREHGKLFYFATPLELTSIDQIGEPAVIEKAVQMLDGYVRAFGPK